MVAIGNERKRLVVNVAVVRLRREEDQQAAESSLPCQTKAIRNKHHKKLFVPCDSSLSLPELREEEIRTWTTKSEKDSKTHRRGMSSPLRKQSLPFLAEV